MVLRNTDLFRHIKHVLGGDLSPELQPIDIVREGADLLSGMHTWRFLGSRQTKLDLRGIVSMVAASPATYTHATRTLTLTGAYATYTFLTGDRFEAAGGTGVVLADYEIESRTDDDNIVLVAPGLGSGADASADITGRIPNDSVALPPDFLQAITISATDSIINGMKWTTAADILRKRTSQIDVSTSWNYYGFVNWDVVLDEGAVPLLSIWPTPQDNDIEAFSMFYRRRIVIADEETAAIPIPSDRPLVNSILIRLCRMIALGYEEGEEAGKPSIDDLLDRFMAGRLWHAAKKQDGLIQPTYGPLKGGAVQRMPRGYRRLLSSEVDSPS